MATPPAVSALIRAQRPIFKSLHDKLAFAIHSILLANGYVLKAVGPAADNASADQVQSGTEEAPVDGWNATASEEQGGFYSFLYSALNEGQQAAASRVLRVKLVIVGDQLLASFVHEPSTAEPATLELDVREYTGGDQAAYEGPAAYAYTKLEALIQKVQGPLQVQGGSPTDRGAKHSTANPASAIRLEREREPPDAGPYAPDDVDPLRVPAARPRIMTGIDAPGGIPMPAGHHSFDPLEGALGGSGPLRPGGGMHVGPTHPVFGGGMPGLGPRPGGFPGGPGPGMRWDPIAPPGLPGSRPGDFGPGGPARGGAPGQIHPDIQQPGPGRGPDWDLMFG